jgi:PAS domain S-box-containing protein
MFRTLRSKIFGGYLLVLLLLAGVGAYSIFSFRSLVQTSSSGLELNAQSTILNLEMYESLVRINEGMLKMLGAEFLQGKRALTEQPAIFTSALQNAHRIAGNTLAELQPKISELLTKVEIVWQKYEALLPEFIRFAEANPLEARHFYDGSIMPVYSELKELSFALSQQNSAAFKIAQEKTSRDSASSTVAVLIVTILALALGLLGSYFIASTTTSPLRELSNNLKSLRRGNLRARLPVRGADEIGEVSFEFNRLTERLEQYEEMNINELLAEKQKSESIISSTLDPLYLFDEEGKLLLLNESAESLLARNKLGLIGKNMSDVFTDELLLSTVMRTIKETKNVNADELLVPSIVPYLLSGKKKYFRITAIPIESAATRIGTLVSLNDITHFQELDALKSDFIARVSHEFRTPLTSMKMSLDLLAKEITGSINPGQRDLVQTLKSDTDRLGKLISDLLTITRLESDSFTDNITKAECDVMKAIAELLRSMKNLFDEKGVKLHSDIAQIPKLRILKSELDSLTQNLVSNALKFTPRGGDVTLKAGYDPLAKELSLIVADTGIGIAVEDQGRIFERFVQVKPTNISSPGSIGLGLAIVTEIAKKYGGKASVSSEIGKGSSFTVTMTVEDAI